MVQGSVPTPGVPDGRLHGDAAQLHRLGGPAGQVPGGGRRVVAGQAERPEGHHRQRHANDPGSAQQAERTGLPPGL